MLKGMSTRFALQSAGSAKERMDELEKFILFWLGPRKPAYGESASALGLVSLPYPLCRLYGFAGQWPPHPHYANEPNVFCVQDYLIPLSGLEYSDDGKLVFLVENQSCWTCATLTQGDDPPVWVAGDYLYPNPDDGEWHLITDSLSKFLVSFCLQELLFGSVPHTPGTRRLSNIDRQKAVPLWTDGPYVGSNRSHNFYLLNDEVLIGPFGIELPWFGLRPATHITGQT